MREVIEILQGFQAETQQTFTVHGILTGVWLRRKRFEIVTKKKTYTGGIADEAVKTVSNVTLGQNYTVTIQETAKKDKATDESRKTKYQLLSLSDNQ